MKHVYIPDVQVRPGDDFRFLRNIGHYLVAKQPDRLICGGDFADMPSLSSYDFGRKSFEGRRYKHDIEATREAMETLLSPIVEYNQQQKRNKQKLYLPTMDLTMGNHEHRIVRAVEDDAKLEGMLSINDLGYTEYGWTQHEFLDVAVLEGVAYSHYFVTGIAGRPASSAAAQLNKKHQSCIAGHQQGLQVAMAQRADGKRITSVIAGSCYEREEEYLGKQGNKHWRGLLMLHSVDDGEFDMVTVPLKYLNERYG